MTSDYESTDDWVSEKNRDELHSMLMARISSLSQVYRSRRLRWRECLQSYLDRELSDDALDDGIDTLLVSLSRKKSTNVISSCVQTVHSHTDEIQPRPMFSTISGSYKLSQRAKQSTRVCREDFARFDYERALSNAQLDALIGDAGICRMAVRGGAPRLERIVPYRLIVDPCEYDRDEPTTFFYVYPSTCRAIAADFPKADRNDIEYAGSVFTDVVKTGSKIHQVDVVEAITLPLGPGKPGRKVVFTTSGILLDLKYTYEWSPYIVMRWTRDPSSFWGQGLVELLAGVQSDVDFKDAKIREHESMIAGKWFHDEDDGITAEELDDMPAIISVAQGKRDPRYVNPPALNAEVYGSKDRSVNSAFSTSGVSQMAAQAEKPAGLDSGAALRAHAAITSKRFRKWQSGVQSAYLQVGRMWAEVIANDPAIDKTKPIKIPVGRGLKVLTYRDIAMDPSKYGVRLEVTSFMGTTPAARFQEAQEYVRVGFLTPQRGLRAMMTGDLEAEQDDMTAAEDLAQQRLEAMVETGQFLAPSPFFDLQLHLDKSTQFYQECELANVDADKLRLIVRYQQRCADLLALAAGKYPGPPPDGAEQPPADDGPPPGPGGPMPPDGGQPMDQQALAEAAAAQAQQQAVQGDAAAQIGAAA